MFNCSICDEIFVVSQKDQKNSTYSTRCGHLFHYDCLTKWLDRSKTCPHCRSSVTKDEIIKLFLQFDPSSHSALSNKIQEDALNDQIEDLRKKEKNYVSTIDRLMSQFRQASINNEENKKSINYFRTKCTDYGCKLFDLQSRHQMLELEFATLSDQKKNVEIKLQLEESKLKALDKNFNELRSVDCIIIDKLRSEIADLKSQKAFYEGKCNSLLDSKSESSLILPPKLTIENKEICLPQICHVKSNYQGNDPNLIWSSTNFLGGCVFLVVEDHNNYEDICNDTSMTKLSIIDFGGTVESVYSSNITHIISATQNHYLVEQGIKDGVRCVTDDWLNDVIRKRVMCPPWHALHFPSRFSKETILPCQNYHIAIAQFDEEDYQLVKKMVELTGACVVDEVTSTTDVVVSQKLEGELVEVALALNRPIVNVQWLNDVLFGASIGLHNPTCMNYQQFDLTFPFSVNYDMVSHLMDAWKSPVVFLTNTEVYDLTTDGSTGPKCKKLKTEIKNPELIDLAHDDDDDDVIITYIGSNLKNTNLPKIMFCGFLKEEVKELKLIVLKLGGYLTDNYCDVTHLVMKTPYKSISFLLSLSSVTYIVNEFWLKESLSSSTFKNELDYCIGNVYDESHLVVCNLPEILKITTRKVLFKGKHFFITPGCKTPSAEIINNLITWSGGVVECQIRSVDSIKSLLPNTYFIISCKEDVQQFDIDLLMFKSINAVFSSDFIIHSIMQQKLMLEYVILY